MEATFDVSREIPRLLLIKKRGRGRRRDNGAGGIFNLG